MLFINFIKYLIYLLSTQKLSMSFHYIKQNNKREEISSKKFLWIKILEYLNIFNCIGRMQNFVSCERATVDSMGLLMELTRCQLIVLFSSRNTLHLHASFGSTHDKVFNFRTLKWDRLQNCSSFIDETCSQFLVVSSTLPRYSGTS